MKLRRFGGRCFQKNLKDFSRRNLNKFEYFTIIKFLNLSKVFGQVSTNFLVDHFLGVFFWDSRDGWVSVWSFLGNTLYEMLNMLQTEWILKILQDFPQKKNQSSIFLQTFHFHNKPVIILFQQLSILALKPIRDFAAATRHVFTNFLTMSQQFQKYYWQNLFRVENKSFHHNWYHQIKLNFWNFSPSKNVLIHKENSSNRNFSHKIVTFH